MRSEGDWLNAPGAGLTAAERRWLRSVAMDVEFRFKDGIHAPLIMNLGIWKGATMQCLRAGAPGAILVGIDRIGGDLLSHGHTLHAEIIRGDVETAWSDFDRAIHLLFFDADHRIDSMRIQIPGWAQFVVDGGVMAFHDYPLPEPRWAVKRAVDEWMSAQPARAWAEIDAPDKLKAFRRGS
jgi:hypothetical protein